MRLLAIAVVMLAVAPGCRSSPAVTQPAEVIFDNLGSTADHWVLVRVQVCESSPEIVCMTSAQLVNALIVEHDLSDEGFNRRLREEINVGSTSRFRFLNADACAIIPRPCSPRLVKAVRAALKGYTNVELLQNRLAANLLHTLELESDDPKCRERVFAQVLIERGLSPFAECFNGEFNVNAGRHNQGIAHD
jgi:hypothetical protein